MKSIGASLLAHMQGQTTTLAVLWKVTRRDGRVFCFTDHDQDLTYGGLTYAANTGFTASAMKQSAALDIDNLEVQGMLTSNTITDDDLLAGLWDYATVEILRVNWADLSMGAEMMPSGILGNVRSGDYAFSAELRGLTQALQQPIGRIYMPSCDADLGDSRCKVTIGTYTVTGTLTAVASNRQFTDSSRAEAANYFNNGLLTWTGGLNAGLSMEVKTFSSGVFTLQQPMQFTVQVGDTYSVYAGCDKTRATCVATFNNVINFRGFPDLPGMDKLTSGK